jgi:hypothetical protein
LLVSTGFSLDVAAQALAGWSVVSTAGDARYRESASNDWRPVIAGIVLAEGSRVATGQAGRVVLSRGSNTVTIAAQSETQVGGARGGAIYQFFQQLGTILLRIENGPDRNFRVRTPYLAATVKGTAFSVSVDDRGGAVHVTQGLVEVASLSSGMASLVRPGQTARVSSAPDAPVEVIGGSGGNGRQGGENPPDAAPRGRGHGPGHEARGESPPGLARAAARGGLQAAFRILPYVGAGTLDYGELSDGLLQQAGGVDSGTGLDRAAGRGLGRDFDAFGGASPPGSLLIGTARGNNGNGNGGAAASRGLSTALSAGGGPPSNPGSAGSDAATVSETAAAGGANPPGNSGSAPGKNK